MRDGRSRTLSELVSLLSLIYLDTVNTLNLKVQNGFLSFACFYSLLRDEEKIKWSTSA